MEKELKKRLNELLETKQLSVNAMAGMIGMQTKTLNNQISTKTAVSAITILSILATFTDVSAEWLLRGSGPMFISEENMEHNNEESLLLKTIRNQQREIDGLYERIDELKGASSVEKASSVIAI